MKTHYTTVNNVIVRYWYDKSLRSWTATAVTAADDTGYQIGDCHFAYSRFDLDCAIALAALERE